MTQQQVDDIKTFYQTFETDVNDNTAKQAASSASVQKKDASRTPLETGIATPRNVANATHATAAAIAATWIPQVSQSAPANATRPIGRVDTSARLQHTISWSDEATPDNKKRPRGTIGAGIYSKIDGPPPTDPSECTFVALDTGSPHVIHYSGDDAGKMAHYMLRWHMRDGSDSAWSETISATITG